MFSTASTGIRCSTHLIAALAGVAVVAALTVIPGRAEAVVPHQRPAAQAAKVAVATHDMTRSEYEQRLGYWINQARDNHSKRSVRVRPCVDGFAGHWARHLARRAKFEHQSLGPIMRECQLASAGEIIAMGGVSPRQMVRMWLNSPSHRDILLSRKYRIAGVGASLGDNNAWYGVVDFGRH